MSSNFSLAELIIRIILGVLLFSQGYDKIFKVKISGVIQTFEHPMEFKIPHFFLVLSSYFTSYIEFLGGLLLIVGLAKDIVLPLIGLDFILVAVAFSIIKPMWDMQFYFPRLILLLILLILPESHDPYSLDHILNL